MSKTCSSWLNILLTSSILALLVTSAPLDRDSKLSGVKVDGIPIEKIPLEFLAAAIIHERAGWYDFVDGDESFETDDFPDQNEETPTSGVESTGQSTDSQTTSSSRQQRTIKSKSKSSRSLSALLKSKTTKSTSLSESDRLKSGSVSRIISSFSGDNEKYESDNENDVDFRLTKPSTQAKRHNGAVVREANKHVAETDVNTGIFISGSNAIGGNDAVSKTATTALSMNTNGIVTAVYSGSNDIKTKFAQDTTSAREVKEGTSTTTASGSTGYDIERNVRQTTSLLTLVEEAAVVTFESLRDNYDGRPSKAPSSSNDKVTLDMTSDPSKNHNIETRIDVKKPDMRMAYPSALCDSKKCRNEMSDYFRWKSQNGYDNASVSWG